MSIEKKRKDIYGKIDPSNPESGLSHSADGRTIIITGAGRGIGRSIALNYAKARASVIVLSSRTTGELVEVKEEISKINSEVKVIIQECDVTSEESVKQLIEVSVKSSPSENVGFTLINNAGYLEPNSFIADSDPSTWWKTWEINVKGTYLPTHYILPHLKNHTSKVHYIINVSSAGSKITRPGMSAYQPTKTAINRFTDFLDVEHRESHNLRTFSVHPGGVMTKLAENMPAYTHHILSDTPELMGGFAVWLGSGQADFVSGRYIEANWDVDDILKFKEKVTESGSQLWKTIVNV